MSKKYTTFVNEQNEILKPIGKYAPNSLIDICPQGIDT